MKKLNVLLIVLCLLQGNVFFAHQHDVQLDVQKNSTEVKKCACGQVIHVFYNCCVKRYNQEFPDAQLLEKNETQGLSDNVIQALEMLAETVGFCDDHGNLIVPEISAKGNRVIMLSRNSYYKACKALLHDFNERTTLSAQELFQLWIDQLA